MPASIFPQNVIALVWDFDRTLIPGYQQDPLFAAYDVDPAQFWAEVAALPGHYARQGILVGRETCYLNHLLTYVAAGRFPDLSNARLADLGASLQACPGIPEFFDETRRMVTELESLAQHDVRVEHYVVSTGIRALMRGTSIAAAVDGLWANDFIEQPLGPGFLSDSGEPGAEPRPISQLGYVLDDTTKTKALFEINKGVNTDPTINVNAPMAADERRVPFRNVIYVADGPSDVPVFSVVRRNGGRTLGVYTTGDRTNFRQVMELQRQERVDSIAEADYRPGTAAYLWLTESIREIGADIVAHRQERIAGIRQPPGHVN
ncbi:HAD family hydrolase [soil metagenome]